MPDWMIDFQLIYPKRAGDQKLAEAIKAGQRRLAQGYSVQQLLEGARRYAKYCEAANSVGTQFVLSPLTFLGPTRKFLQAWDPPTTNAQRLHQKSVEAMEGFLAGRYPCAGAA